MPETLNPNVVPDLSPDSPVLASSPELVAAQSIQEGQQLAAAEAARAPEVPEIPELDVSTQVDPNALVTPHLRSSFNEYDTAQVAEVVRHGGIAAFPQALHYSGNADQAFRMTLGQVPDKEAKIQFYARFTGLPNDFVRANYDKVEKEYLFSDFREIVKDKPKLAKFMAEPENAVLLRDSGRYMYQLEGLLVSRYGSVGQQFGAGLEGLASTTATGLIGAAELAADVTEKVFFESSRGIAEFLTGEKVPEEALTKQFESALENASEWMGERRRYYQSTVAPLNEEVNGLYRFSIDATVGAVQLVEMVGLGMINPAIPLVMIGAQEAGGTYGVLKDQGTPLWQAAPIALSVGTINGYLENIKIKNVANILGVKRKMSSVGRSFVRNLLTDVTENAVQETVQNVVTEAGLILGDIGVKPVNINSIMSRLGTSVSEGAYEGLTVAVASAFFAAPGAVSSISRIVQARSQMEFLKQATGLVEAMPALKRAPGKARDAVDALLEGQQTEKASLNPDDIETYFQNATAKEKELFLNTLGVSTEQYNEARIRGEEIQFQTADWLTKIASTEAGVALFGDMRIGDNFTVNEAHAAKDALLERGDRLIASMLDVAGVDKATAEELVKFREAIIATGLYGREAAQGIVDLFEAGGEQFAKVWGQSKSEWLTKNLPTLASGVDAAQFLNKRPEGAEFQSAVNGEQFNIVSEGDLVDGRVVRDDVPNTDSISASLVEYEVLPGIREIPLSVFGDGLSGKDVRVDENRRIAELSEEIKASGEIAPIIIVDDGNPEGPYILEGGHRAEALFKIGAKSVPALVVNDIEAIRESRASQTEVAKRIAKALDPTKTGPNVTDEVAAPPETYFQLGNLDTWKTKTEKWMKKNEYSEKEIKDHLAAIDGQMAIFSSLGPIQIEMLPKGAGQTTRTPGVAGDPGPFRTNADPIYKITFDASAMCVKRLEAAATANAVQKEIGRALNTSERMALVSMFRAAGKQAPCLYCYVEAPRAKSAEFVKNATDTVFKKIKIKEGWSKKSKDEAKAAIKEAKKLGLKPSDVDANVLLDPEYGITDEALEKITSAPDVYRFLKSQFLAAKANLPKLYEEYNGQVLNIKQELLDDLNQFAGLRFFSSSDFQAEHVADLVQAFIDMDVRDAKSHSYTKVSDFVEIFGATGMKIQTSVFAGVDANGNITEDASQGMEWAKAKALRKQFDDVGSVLVAADDRIVQWGLEQDWIDYIIPFHYSGLEKKFYGTLGRQDFTSTQSEKAIAKGEEANKIRMHEIGTAAGMTDEASTRAYLKMAMERKLHPVFPSFLFKDYKPAANDKDRAKQNREARDRWAGMVEAGDIVWDDINPNYFKLRKDYARSDTPFNSVDSNQINLEKARAVLDTYLEGNAPKSKVDKGIATALTALIKEAENTDRDIGVEMLEAAKKSSADQAEFYAQQDPNNEFLGATQFTESGPVVTLFQNANRSTLVHEIGHIFIKNMTDAVAAGVATEQMVADLAVLTELAGGELNRDGIEKIARAWEAYLFEGKAPKASLGSAFQNFKNWLLDIYRSIRNLIGVDELSPDLRTAFNHWLATDEDLSAAEAYHRKGEAIKDVFDAEKQLDEARRAADAEGTDEEVTSAEAKLEAARLKVQEAEELEREREAQRRLKAHKELYGGRKALRETATAEINERPVYKAIAEIRELHGIDRAALAAIMPQGDVNSTFLQLLEIHGPTVVNERQAQLDLDQLASKHGYSSGLTLIDGMLEALPKTKAITEYTNALEQEKEAQFKAIAEEDASGIVNDEAHIDFILADLEVMNRRVSKAREVLLKKAEYQAMRDQIRAILSSQYSGRDAARFTKWKNAEGREAANAFAAAARGDMEKAIVAREKQLYFAVAVRESFKIREELSTVQRRWMGSKVKFEKDFDPKFRTFLHDLITTFGFNKTTKPPKGAQPDALLMPADGLTGAEDEALRDITATAENITPEWVRLKQEATNNFKDLTFDQILLLDSIMRWAVAEGKGSFKSFTELGWNNVNELLPEVIRRMEQLSDQKRSDPRTIKGFLEGKLRRGEAFVQLMELLFVELDGDPLAKGQEMGPLQSIVRLGSDQESENTLMLKELLEGDPKMIEHLQTLSEAQNRLKKENGGKDILQIENIPFPEVLKRKRDLTGWDTNMLVMVALQLGNDKNEFAVREGEYQIDTEAFKRSGIFTKAEWLAIQGIWEGVNTLFPQLNSTIQNLTMQHVVKEDAQALQVRTAEGEILQLKGGYFPRILDGVVDEDVAAWQEKEAMTIGQQDGAIFRTSPRPKNNMAIARKETDEGDPASKKSPLLNTSVIWRHLRDTTRLITHSAYLRDLDRLTRNHEFRDVFVRKMGREMYEAMRKWVNYQARPQRRMNNDLASEALEFGRAQFVRAILGMRPFTSFKQRLSMYNGISEAGKAGTFTKYLTKAMHEMGFGGNVIGRPPEEVVDFVHGLSKNMAVRSESFDRDLNDLIGQLKTAPMNLKIGGKKVTLTRSKIDNVIFWGIKSQDRATTYPLWLGSYYQAIGENLNGIKEDMSEEDKAKRAAKYADAIISTSQPAGSPIDLAELQRGEGLYRVITTFMTFRIKDLNRFMKEARHVARKTKDGQFPWKDVVRYVLLERMAPAWTWLIPTYFFYDDEEDQAAWYDYVLKPFEDLVGTVPILSQAKDSLRGWSGWELPIAEGFKRPTKALQKALAGKPGQAAWETWRTIEFWIGLPVSNAPVDILRTLDKVTGDD